ncbi:prolyl oligopeptidase family serine peptidase [Salinicola rhizosphaerae]|uniref:Prolyl oligopeptidase n=1 Tax=Salinicola rhizosphaerae TaxID=1443141 RepID=A0ABQ3DRK1_9GAMM|nr:prolyl oligopeptidase family serine peptidase [Salinicola rhizosphaerae]GHB13165.1 prolyl oligopeptidase [Salinicola rhizosphaerae]
MRRFPLSSYCSSDDVGGRAGVGGDPYRWLEAVESTEALEWVQAQNRRTLESLEDGDFRALEAGLREILDADDRIPFAVKRGEHYYNFWQDAEHPRGLWRRTSWASYRQAEPEWEVLIDVDSLNAAEDENWVWHGARCLEPEVRNGRWERALIALSRGGADADVTREFDLIEKRWIDDVEGGFARAEAKGGMSWIDRDTVFVYTDFGSDSLTTSGYPRQVKRWRRGEPMAAAETVFEAVPTELMAVAFRDTTRGFERDFVHHALSFYEQRLIELTPTGEFVIDVPLSAQASVHREWLTVHLRDDWTPGETGATYASGTLLAIDYDAFKRGGRDFTALFVPDAHRSLEGFEWTRHFLVLDVLEDVKHRLQLLTPGEGIDWSPRAMPGLPEVGEVGVAAIDDEESDEVFLTTTDYLTPTTLSTLDLADGAQATPEPIKRAPSFFDAAGMRAEQRFATSADGTRIPYFLVLPAGVEGDKPDAPLPTLLYGYGGFEISLTPHYIAGAGRSWLARGGAYVVANIRGGGEYGPRWHRAALKGERHKAFEDFAAVAEELVATGITTPARLGIQGGSNGGLLVGNMITRYPHHFAAAVCEVPLLDMQRYHELLAGASWMAEYGDPESDDWENFLEANSPYHNLREGVDYPAVLFTTSTRDDRVHPGHARKMMAKMQAAGCDVTYYENTEGGHGGAADNAQRARMSALTWRFLWARLAGESS